MFRHDRVNCKKSSGGVFIAVKNYLIASNESHLNTDCEIEWISISVTGLSPVYIGAYYRPPTSDVDYAKELDASLSKIPPNANIWLLGDFNLPDVDWETVAFRPGGYYPAQQVLD